MNDKNDAGYNYIHDIAADICMMYAERFKAHKVILFDCFSLSQTKTSIVLGSLPESPSNSIYEDTRGLEAFPEGWQKIINDIHIAYKTMSMPQDWENKDYHAAVNFLCKHEDSQPKKNIEILFLRMANENDNSKLKFLMALHDFSDEIIKWRIKEAELRSFIDNVAHSLYLPFDFLTPLFIQASHQVLRSGVYSPYFTYWILSNSRLMQQLLSAGKRKPLKELMKTIVEDYLYHRILHQASEIYENRSKYVNIPYNGERISNLIDIIGCIYIDMCTSLAIVPSSAINTNETDPLEELAYLKIPKLNDGFSSEHLLLTKIANLRRQFFIVSKQAEFPKKRQIGEICKTLERKEIWKDEYRLLMDLPNKLLSGDCAEVSNKLSQYSKKKYLKLEALRTCFFYLHYAYSGRYPGWGRMVTKKGSTEDSGVADATELQNAILPKKYLKALFRGAESSSRAGSGDGASEEIHCDGMQKMLSEFLAAYVYNESPVITSEWLAAWLVLTILRDEVCDEVAEKREYSPNQRATYFRHFSTLCLYLIHWMKYGGDAMAFIFSDVKGGYERVVESKLYLIAAYAHAKLGLHWSIPLVETLKEMWASEALFYTAKDFYREHLHHAVDICLLGLLLIDAGILDRLRPKSGLLRRSTSETDVETDKRHWIVASLLHDAGYGLHLEEDVLKQTQYLDRSDALKSYRDGLKEALGKLEKPLLKEFPNIIPGVRIDKIEHAAASALFVASLHDTERRKQLNENWIKDIAPALKAIVQHNEPVDEVKASQDPLAFLLFLCDRLQEWERPRAEDGFRTSLAAHLLKPTVWSPDTTNLLDHIVVNLKKKEQNGALGWELPTSNEPLKFGLFFRRDPMDRFEPALLWAQNSYDFQNICNKSLKLGVEIKFHHPLKYDRTEYGHQGDLTELDLFHDFVLEYHDEPTLMASFSDWLSLVRSKKTTNKAGTNKGKKPWMEHSFRPPKRKDPAKGEESNADETGDSYDINGQNEEDSRSHGGETFVIRLGPGTIHEPEKPIPMFKDNIYGLFAVWKRRRLRLIKSFRQNGPTE